MERPSLEIFKNSMYLLCQGQFRYSDLALGAWAENLEPVPALISLVSFVKKKELQNAWEEASRCDLMKTQLRRPQVSQYLVFACGRVVQTHPNLVLVSCYESWVLYLHTAFCSFFHLQLLVYHLKLSNPANPAESQSRNPVGLCFPLGLLVSSVSFQLFFSLLVEKS